MTEHVGLGWRLLPRGRTRSVRTRNSVKPSRTSLILWKGAHLKIQSGQNILMKSPVPTISIDCLKLILCPGGTSSSPQFMRFPKPAAEIVMRANWNCHQCFLANCNTVELTAIVRLRVLSRTISCFPFHSPSYKEVMALTDSSKASFLFFYE